MSDRRRNVTGSDPDFVIIGAMKSGTTTLFNWLGSLPSVTLPDQKELDFFSVESKWDKGLDWYKAQFPGNGTVSGEASPSYTYPENATIVADRMRQALARPRLIVSLREPVERLRSHYRHEVQRGRETRRLGDAATQNSDYVARSMYWRCLSPFLDRFEEAELLIVRFDDLISDSGLGWHAVLKFLDLPENPLPSARHTPSADKPQLSSTFRFLWKSGALKYTKFLPPAVRNVGKRILTSNSSEYRALIDSSRDPLPDALIDSICDDTQRLERQLDRILWEC